MHEMSVMSYLLETVQAEALEHGARKVLAVNLVMGDRASMVDDSLLFYFDLLAPGTLAELTVPELAGQVFQAKVVRQAGIMETGSRTMLVELEVTNEKRQIMAGSYAQVRFQEATSEAVLTLPANSILFRAEGPQVALVQSDGTVELRRVELGRDFGPTIEVLSGLKATDSAVLNPMDSLANGAKVRVAEPPQDQKPAHRSTDANVAH